MGVQPWFPSPAMVVKERTVRAGRPATRTSASSGSSDETLWGVGKGELPSSGVKSKCREGEGSDGGLHGWSEELR